MRWSPYGRRDRAPCILYARKLAISVNSMIQVGRSGGEDGVMMTRALLESGDGGDDVAILCGPISHLAV